jgi:hypothetical protein
MNNSKSEIYEIGAKFIAISIESLEKITYLDLKFW